MKDSQILRKARDLIDGGENPVTALMESVRIEDGTCAEYARLLDRLGVESLSIWSIGKDAVDAFALFDKTIEAAEKEEA